MTLTRPVKIAAGLAATLLAAVGALFAFLWSLDLERHKPLVADIVRAATGREVAIAGPLVPRFGLSPALTAEGVSLSNAAWGDHRPMFTAERLEAQLRLMPLITSLGRHIVIERIVLSGAELWLETDGTGGGNWRFGDGAARAPGSRPAAGTGQAPDVEVLEVELRKLRVGLKLGHGAPTTLTIDRATLRGASEWDQRAIAGSGRYEDLPFEFDGRLRFGAQEEARPLRVDLVARSGDRARLKVAADVLQPLAGRGYAVAIEFDMPEIGALGEMVSAAGLGRIAAPALGRFEFALALSDRGPAGRVSLDSLRLRLGEGSGLRAAIDGAVRDPLGLFQDPPAPLALDMRIEAAADDFASAMRRLRGADAPRGALRVDGRLRGDAAPGLRLEDFRIAGPRMDVAAEAELSFAGGRPALSARIAGRTLDLRWLAGGAGQERSDRASRQAERVVPDVALPFALLAAIDLDLALRLDEAVLSFGRLERIAITAKGRDGEIRVAPFRFLMDKGSFDLETTVSAAARSVAQRVAIDGLDLGAALTARGLPDWTTGGQTRMRADLRGQGDDLRAIARTLAGEVDIDVGQATLGAGLRRRSSELATAISPSLAQIQLGASVRCAAYALRFADGVGTLHQGVVDMRILALRSAGTIDLGEERLALRTQIGPLGVRTIGMLAAPEHRLDAAGTARGVAEGAAAMARGLLGPLGENRARMGSDCDREDAGQQSAPAAAPAQGAEPSPAPVPTVPGLLRNLLGR